MFVLTQDKMRIVEITGKDISVYRLRNGYIIKEELDSRPNILGHYSTKESAIDALEKLFTSIDAGKNHRME